MNRTRWRTTLAVMGVLLLTGASVRTEEARAAESALEEQALTVVKRMATVLSQAQQFSFTADGGFDVVQDSGEKIEFGETRKFAVRRPDHARVDVTKRDGSSSGFVFDGQQLAVFNVQDKVYATAAKPGTLDEAIAYFINELDMRLPLGQLLSSTLPQVFQDWVQAADYVEPATIAGVPCDHLALRGDRADVQLWVAQGDQPLLQRLVITYTRAEGQPQFWAQFSGWNFSPALSDALFAFTPSEGAAKIVFAPRQQSGSGETAAQGGQQ